MKITKKFIKSCIDFEQLEKSIGDKNPDVSIKNYELLDKTIRDFLKNKIYPQIKLLKERKDVKLCSHCNKYFIVNVKKVWWEQITRRVLVYTDAGYGDDDVYADMQYNVQYMNCPYCKSKTNVGGDMSCGTRIKGTETDRWGNKVN